MKGARFETPNISRIIFEVQGSTDGASAMSHPHRRGMHGNIT